MERRNLSRFSLTAVAFSVFLNASFVLSRPREVSRFILGEQSLGSWKDEILNSNAESPGPSIDVINTLVLAENRTQRPDILSKFHKYKGGWDIANKHYWASVGFTGALAFILAILWFVSFGIALAFHYFCSWKISLLKRESKTSLRISLFLLFIFTAAAAAGCILLSVGQDRFHGETLRTLNYVVNQSEYTVRTLRNVTEYLLIAKTVKVAQILLPPDAKDDIDRLNTQLNAAADTLEEKTDENSMKIRKVFNAVRSALIAVAVIMLLISVLGLVLSLHGHHHAIHIFIVSGWILVAVAFLLCGVFVILNNAISDTCMAMREWTENPQAETALSNILPCVDQKTTNQTLYKSKQVVNDIIGMANGFLGSVANTNPPAQRPSSPNYYNQSGPLVPYLCFPYDSQLRENNCSSDSQQQVSLNNASTVWKNYTCLVSTQGMCATVGRLTPTMYSELLAAVNSSFALTHYTPPLLNLQNCNFVRETFGNITASYCPPLGRDLRLVNAGLALISVGVMLSLALWMLYANRPQREEAFAARQSVK